MISTLITNILKFQFIGLPSAFSVADLQERAESLVDELGSLLNIDSLLEHTKVAYNFQVGANEKLHPCLYIVIGLALKDQTLLNFNFLSVTAGEIQAQMLEDRQRLIKSCNDLPMQSSSVVNALSNRINAASLKLPVEELRPEIARRLGSILRVKQQTWVGTVTDSPFEHQLPELPRYEWHPAIHNVRVMLTREKRGFSLRFLERPSFAMSKKTLPMPERPSDRSVTELLERAEFNQDPLDISIRVGTRPGFPLVVVADFVGFKAKDQCC